jgi:hypothetical protein
VWIPNSVKWDALMKCILLDTKIQGINGMW